MGNRLKILYYRKKAFDPDVFAARIGQVAAQAKAMPPSWDGCEDRLPVSTQDGVQVGWALPGRGVYLNYDLKYLTGIRKPIPNVFERSRVMRFWDMFQDNRKAIAAAACVTTALMTRNAEALLPLMGAITTYDGIINARAQGKAFDGTFVKTTVTTVANQWSEIYAVSGGNPAAGTFTSIPGGAAMSRTTTGALNYWMVDPTNPDKKYLLTFGFTSGAQINMGILADLLVNAGSISATVTTSQTINSTALTRYTGGGGVMATYTITTALGATASNATTTYTNQDGTGSRSTGALSMLQSGIVNRLAAITLGPVLQLQSGDYGVRSVESVTLSANMGAGVFALILYKPLMFLPGIASNAYAERDSTTQIDGLTELVETAGGVLGCLGLFVFPSGTSSGLVVGFMRTCDG